MTQPLRSRVRGMSPSALRAIACTGLLALGGCASPYATLEPEPPLPVATASNMLPAQPLDDAIGRARSVQSTYRAKVVELGEADRALQIGILSLSAVALGMAYGGANAHDIGGVVLGTGALYTGGNAMNDRRRAQIYLYGMKALECSVDAVSPLVLSDKQRDRIDEDRRRIDPAIEHVGKSLGRVTRAAAYLGAGDDAGAKALVDQANTMMATADAALAKAGEAWDLSTQRQERPRQLAIDLRTAVSRIDRAVLDELRGTENSLQSLPTIVGGLQSNATLFASALGITSFKGVSSAGGSSDTATIKGRALSRGASRDGSPDGSSPDLSDRVELATALGDLRRDTVVLASLAGQLARDAGPGMGASSSLNLKNCDVDQAVKSITASPASVQIAAKTAVTQSVLVDGGNGNYTAMFLQTPTPGLTAGLRPRSNGVVDIVATDQTVAGGVYQLVIEDTTRTARQVVTVSVTANTDNADAPAATGSPNVAAGRIRATGKVTVAGHVVTWSQDEVEPGPSTVNVTYHVTDGSDVDDRQVSQALYNLPGVSAALGAKATASSIVCRQAKVSAKGKRVTMKPAANAATPTAGGSAAADPARQTVATLQRRLCMKAAAVTGTWDAASQAALVADRVARNPPVRSDGPITAQERTALLALSDAQAAQRCAGR